MAQIRDWRREMGLPPEPQATQADLVGRPCHASATSSDICSLAEAICDNAEQICVVAGERRNDAPAIDKCKSAKLSCREVSERCCASSS